MSRYTLAREDSLQLDRAAWSDAGQDFGAMPLSILMGDFLQLRPHAMGVSDSPVRVAELWADPKTRPSKLAQA